MQEGRHYRLTRAARSIAISYRNLPIHSKLSVCRFFPSCSEYGVEALKRFGLLRGGWLTICRLLRCHPFAKWGVDLLP